MPGSFHNSDNENDNRTIIRSTDQDTEITPASTAEATVPAKTLYPRVSSTSVAAEKPMAVDTNRDLQRALLTANRLRAERDQYKDIAGSHEEELTRCRLENERLQAEFTGLRDEFNAMKVAFREGQAVAQTRVRRRVSDEDHFHASAHSREQQPRHPEQGTRGVTVDTEFTHRTRQTAATDLSIAATWRPRGTHPIKPLSGLEQDDYKPWRYQVDRKIATDSPMYATDRDKIDYALSQMKEPIFSDMQGWVADESSVITYLELMDEVEHFMNIHLQEGDAKKELLSIKQRQGESITQYYHRIRPLWQKAKTGEEERIEKFLTTMHPRLSGSLLSRDYDSVRELLDNARKVEDRKKDIHFNYPHHMQKPDHTQKVGNETERSTAGTVKPVSQRPNYKPGIRNDTGTTNAPRTSVSGNPNARFGPVAKKPNGWFGVWHDPVQKPGRMDQDEKVTMIRQGRCWRCRGSGHRSHDLCCPASKTNLDIMATGELVHDESSSEDSAHSSGKV